MADKIHPAPAEFTDAQLSSDPILRYFHYAHLPQPLQNISSAFCGLAGFIVAELPRNAERTVALRKLLEAKDAGVRANVGAAVKPETYVDRMAREYNDLATRFDQLANFIETPAFFQLPAQEQLDLRVQYEAMGNYREVLQQRLERAQKIGEEPNRPEAIDDGVRIIGGDKSEEPIPFS